MRRILGTWPRATAFALLIAAWSGSAPSEVTLDGSLGGARGPLPGPDFEIDADFGRQVGRNLFHSFDAFNLNDRESATFNDVGASGLIENILSRVTGRSASTIDGMLATDFDNATPNLFLLNPHGIVFGPNAKLDVQGSFHASTADYLRLDGDKRFFADRTKNSALISAPPQAFGFLGRQDPAPIEVNGSFLQVPAGKALSLIGGDIQLHSDGFFGAGLIAPAGRVNLASVGAKAEVTVGPNDLGVEPGSRGGTVTLSDGSLIDTSGEGGGSVFIRGGEFVMDGSEVRSNTLGVKNGGVVSIEANEVELRNGAQIGTITEGSGRGSDIVVDAESVSLTEGSRLSARTLGATGTGGDVTVTARDRVEVRNGAKIFTLTGSGSGHGGNVLVDADRVSLSGDGSIVGAVASSGTGAAGAVTVKARDRVEVRNGATITAATAGAGPGGKVVVDADRVFLSADGSRGLTGIVAPTETGPGGTVTVRAREVEVRNGALITTSTIGRGHAGDVRVDADRVFLSGDGAVSTGISSEPLGESPGAGRAGAVTVKARDLRVRDGARISSSTFGPAPGGAVAVAADEIVLEGRDSGLFARAGGTAADSGGGGDLTVNAGSLMVKEGATISASTFGPGPGGKLSITAVDLELRDRASITSASISKSPNAGRAGNIDLDVGFLLHLRDSTITTSVVGGEGRGGNIKIDPVFVVLDNSEIRADAFGGPGGNVDIVADFFFGPLQNVSASSGNPELSGTVEIDSPETDLNAGLIELPANFFDAATLLTQGCAAGADLSRLVVRKYEVLPDSPAALRVPPPGGLLNADAQDAGYALTRETLGPDFEHSSACDGDG